jgi:hypothetical protein
MMLPAIFIPKSQMFAWSEELVSIKITYEVNLHEEDEVKWIPSKIG